MEYKITNVSESKISISGFFVNEDQKFNVSFYFNYENFIEGSNPLDLKDSVIHGLLITNENKEEIILDKKTLAKILQEIYTIILQEYQKENEFIKKHCTGHIPSSSYKENIKERDMASYPKLLKVITLNSGEEVELRQTGELLKYVLKDNEDNIVRDSNGLALYLNEDQMKEKGLNLYDTSIVAFNSDKKSIGLASDEWGADGVWVNKEYQRQGLGTELLTELRKQFKNDRKMGQMTDAGIELARSYYRKSLMQN